MLQHGKRLQPARARTVYETLEPDQPGTPPRIITYPHDEDLAAVLSDIP